MGASGTTTLNFGAFPGGYDTSVAVTGQAGIVAGSLVEAWIRPEDTADHTADEHMLEPFRVFAGNIAAGTGFTIYGFNDNHIITPADKPPDAAQQRMTSASAVLWTLLNRIERPASVLQTEPTAPRLYGAYTVAWVWN